jgi:hypothetical protein
MDSLLDLIQELAQPPGTTEVRAGREKALPPKPFRKDSVSTSNTDFVELAQRSSETALSERERSLLYSYLLSLTKEAVLEFQIKTRPQQTIQSSTAPFLYDLDVEQYGIYFEHNFDKANPIQERLVYIRPKLNNSLSPRFQIFIPPGDGSYSITVEPSRGKVRCISLDRSHKENHFQLNSN